MELKIKNWEKGLTDGLEVEFINESPPEGDYYDWRPSNLITKFSTNEIAGGIVKARDIPVSYDKIEYHDDFEAFYFVSGEGVMLFCDISGGEPDNFLMLRVKEGMKLSVAPDKAHYVPISTKKGETIEAVVISPKMNTYFIDLKENITAAE